ncbi:MAG TPA: patatin-like phospholipase family protein, partial [Anaerolineae bacterium]
MRAFVLSGGGNRGPLEVGAMQALLEAGIVPEMVAGSSAGAL